MLTFLVLWLLADGGGILYYAVANALAGRDAGRASLVTSLLLVPWGGLYLTLAAWFGRILVNGW